MYAFAAISDVAGTLTTAAHHFLRTERTYHVSDDLLSASRYLELWVKDDMTLAVVSCFRIVFDDKKYLTEYREIKEDGWPVTDAVPDIEELFCGIQDMHPEEFDPDAAIAYES